MSVEAELADGTILEFPDGTDQNVIDRTVKRHIAQTARAPAAKPAAKPAPKVISREDEIKRLAREQLARENAGRQGLTGDLAEFGEAGREGITKALTFNTSPKIQAFIASKMNGVPYEDALTYHKARSDAILDKSTSGNVVGSLAGGVGLGTGLAAGATRVARAGIPLVSQGANWLSNVLNLQRGQTWGNLGRLGAQGAGYGAAYAAGDDKDVGEGALYGGGLAVGLGAAGNTAGAILRQTTRPVAGTTGQGLRELISEDADTLALRQQEMSQATGENVPLIGALRERDNNSVRNSLLRTSDDANEAAKDYTTNYVRDYGRRILQHVTNAGGRAGMRRTNTPAELTQLRDQTADQLMAPIENQRLDVVELPTQDLERQFTLRAGGRIQGLGARIEQAIGDITPAERVVLGIPPTDVIPEAAQLATRIYAGRGPIDATVRELESVRRLLNGAARGAARAGNEVDAEVFRNASRELVDYISTTYPAYRNMIDTYAGQSRMLEGFLMASKGKRITDLTDVTDITNMNSQEGRLGMRLGEFARQSESAAKSTPDAIRLSRELADPNAGLTRQAGNQAQPGTVTENMGPQAAQELQDAAGTDYRVLQRMMQAGGTDVANLSDEALASPATLAYGIAAMSPNSMMVSRARFLGNLTGLLPTGYSPRVAQNMTDMLFSADPAQTQQAINALRRLGVWEAAQRALAAPAGQAGAGLASPEQPAPAPEVAPAPAEPPPGPQSSNDQSFDDLASRVEMAESNSDQNAVSSAGAIGVMQVMPETAPDAARMAGVEFDAKKYRTDAEYNRKIGRAYLKEMLRRFGDEELALVAYNWGPTNLSKTLKAGKSWRDVAPQKTLDYVEKILG